MQDKLLEELLKSASETQSVLGFEEEDKKLAPLLDEINLIEDHAIRFYVRSVLLDHPTFWVGPASIKHHPPDEKGPGGNVLHAKRVARVAEILCDSQERSSYEKDIVIAAALLHDLTKLVKTPDGEWEIDKMHPYTVEAYVKQVFQRDNDLYNEVTRSTTLYLDDEIEALILRLVRCHLGIWSPVPETIPVTTLDWMLHWADNIASKLHYIVDGPDYRVERWILDEHDKPEVSETPSSADKDGSDSS